MVGPSSNTQFLCPFLEHRLSQYCHSELFLRAVFQPLSHLFSMLFAFLPLCNSLVLQTSPHGTVHIIAMAKELLDIVLRVALLQQVYQYVALVRVQVRRQIRVHSELRAYHSNNTVQLGYH